MGCDGGTIPRRVEMVRLAKKQPKLDDETSSRIRWQVCSISEQPLVEPIVTDDLGNVMNREAVLEALVNKSLGKRFKHIKSLKDVITLKLTPNPQYKEFEKRTDSDSSSVPSQFVCPVVGHEMNGKYRFSAIRPCGHVVSEKAIQEIQGQSCLVCNVSYTAPDDIIPLHPTADMLDILKERIAARRAAVKASKKDKAASHSTSHTTATHDADAADPAGADKNSKKRKLDAVTASQESKSAASARDFVQNAIQKAASSHSELTGKSDTYKNLFTSEKKSKISEPMADVDAFLVRGTARGYF